MHRRVPGVHPSATQLGLDLVGVFVFALSGGLAAVRARLDLAGHKDVGIYVSGGLTAERIREFEAAKAPVDSYGVGMSIAAAPPIAFTADIKEIGGKPTAKRGRIPGIAANPRLRRVVSRDRG